MGRATMKTMIPALGDKEQESHGRVEKDKGKAKERKEKEKVRAKEQMERRAKHALKSPAGFYSACNSKRSINSWNEDAW